MRITPSSSILNTRIFLNKPLSEDKTIPNVAIYLDLDGVLADFEKKAREIFPEFSGMEDWFHRGVGSKYEYNKLYKRMVFKIMETPNFWSSLPWMSDGKKIFSFVTDRFHRDQIGVLTAPMNQDKRCESEKYQWIQKHLTGINTALFFCDTRKEKYVNKIPGRLQILIDDRKKNIDKWQQAGGIGIHHTSANSSIRQLEKILSQDKDKA